MSQLALSLLTLFLAMVVQVVVPPMPAELIVIVAGRNHGVWATAAVAGSGLFAGSILVYHASRLIQRRFHRLFRKEHVERVIDRLREHSTPILWIRILPYNPSDVISYAAGLIDVAPRRYYSITACTSVVRCLGLATLGVHLRDVRTTLQILGVLALSSLVAWALLYGRARRSGEGEP